VGREGGNRFGEACRGRVYLPRGADEPEAARRRWWRIRAGNWGRQASLCKHVLLVVKTQLVIHLQTRHQKTDIGLRMARGVPHSRLIQENWSKERTRQGETKVRWKAHPGGREAADRG